MLGWSCVCRRFWGWIQIHLPAVVTYVLAGRCCCRLVLSEHWWDHIWQEWALRRCLEKALSALVCKLAFILHLCASNTSIIHGRVGRGVRDRRAIRRKEETGLDIRLWRWRWAVPKERGNMGLAFPYVMWRKYIKFMVHQVYFPCLSTCLLFIPWQSISLIPVWMT